MGECQVGDVAKWVRNALYGLRQFRERGVGSWVAQALSACASGTQMLERAHAHARNCTNAHDRADTWARTRTSIRTSTRTPNARTHAHTRSHAHDICAAGTTTVCARSSTRGSDRPPSASCASTWHTAWHATRASFTRRLLRMRRRNRRRVACCSCTLHVGWTLHLAFSIGSCNDARCTLRAARCMLRATRCMLHHSYSDARDDALGVRIPPSDDACVRLPEPTDRPSAVGACPPVAPRLHFARLCCGLACVWFCVCVWVGVRVCACVPLRACVCVCGLCTHRTTPYPCAPPDASSGRVSTPGTTSGTSRYLLVHTLRDDYLSSVSTALKSLEACTRTHARTQARTHSHSYTLLTHARKHTRPHARTHTHARTHGRTHARPRARVDTAPDTHTRKKSCRDSDVRNSDVARGNAPRPPPT